MKSRLVGAVISVFLILFGQSAWGYTQADYYRCTRDIPILQALTHLGETKAAPSLDYILKNRVRLIMKDMREFGKAYRDYDALTIITDDNQQVIFISQKHFTAPPQAIAALISHEILHNDRENSMQEELTAWAQEGETWRELVALYPQLQKIPMRTFPLVDRLNAINVLVQHDKLAEEIQKNIVYRDLPARSPGF